MGTQVFQIQVIQTIYLLLSLFTNSTYFFVLDSDLMFSLMGQ